MGFLGRILVEGFLLGIRLDITAAVLAVILFGALRVLRRDVTIDQSFTAVAFALTPLIVTPIAAIPALLDAGLLLVSGLMLGAIVLRVLVGLGLNLRSILPLPFAAVALLVLLVSGTAVLNDQVSRLRMTGYTMAPSLAPRLPLVPAWISNRSAKVQQARLGIRVAPLMMIYRQPRPKNSASKRGTFY